MPAPEPVPPTWFKVPAFTLSVPVLVRFTASSAGVEPRMNVSALFLLITPPKLLVIVIEP